MPNDTFKKIKTVEISQEDADLWEWFIQKKDMWQEARNLKRGRIILNVSHEGRLGVCEIDKHF